MVEMKSYLVKRRFKFLIIFCQLVALGRWAGYIISLSLSFLISEVETILQSSVGYILIPYINITGIIQEMEALWG